MREPAHPPAAVLTSWWRAWLNLFTVSNLSLQRALSGVVLILLAVGGLLVIERWRLRGQLYKFQTEQAALQQREQVLLQQLAQQRADNDQQAAQLRARNDQQAVQLRAELERMRRRLKEQELQRQAAQASPGSDLSNRDLNIARVELTPLRNADAPALILTRETGYVNVELALDETDQYVAYRVELLKGSALPPLWQSPPFEPHPKEKGQAIYVNLPARLLQSGGYTLRLSGLAPDGGAVYRRGYGLLVKRQ